MTPSDLAINDTLVKEGLFSDRATDSGGKTKFGITEAVARENGYFGDMRDLTEQEARAIYKKRYWDKMSLDLIAVHSQAIATELFDSGVLCGTHNPQVWLQRVLSVANNRQKHYPDLKVDGKIGPTTALALKKYLKLRKEEGELVMLFNLNALLANYVLDIAERREKDEDSWYGWNVNRVLGSFTLN